MIPGGVECGPNAVLAFAREGYRARYVNLRDLSETLAYRGFLAGVEALGTGWARCGDRSARRVRPGLQRLVPEIDLERLVSAPAGVRAQAVRPTAPSSTTSGS